MIDQPDIVRTESRRAAVIHLTIPREEIRQVMGPAIGELMGAIAAQGITPTGPNFTHHLRMEPDIFDFEVGVPVSAGVADVGRVRPGDLPAATVARTTYHGPYEDLHSAWNEFDGWVRANGHVPAGDLWESYVAGPESSDNPEDWHTELYRRLK
jgi:effector-binding domain-containing protein